MAASSLVTAEELYSRGDMGPCELLEGHLMMMTPAGGKHGAVAARVNHSLMTFISPRGLGAVCAAETGFLIARDPDTVRAPDVSFIARERIPPGGPPDSFWPFAPDLAVEVVSPSDRWTDVDEKATAWLRAGSRLVWVVDPRLLVVYVYRPDKDVLRLTQADRLSGFDVLPGFDVAVADFFA